MEAPPGGTPVAEDLVATFRASHAVTLRLLDALPDAALAAAYAPRTRTALAQFAHLHGVRVFHLEARGKGRTDACASFPRGATPSRKEVRAALVASADAIEEMLRAAVARGKVPSWKGPPATWVGYLVAHEAHHRGLALAACRVAGVKIPQEVVHGLWSAWNAGPA
jgi:uncharacterized damage-inducible protein DinB